MKSKRGKIQRGSYGIRRPRKPRGHPHLPVKPEATPELPNPGKPRVDAEPTTLPEITFETTEAAKSATKKKAPAKTKKAKPKETPGE